MIQKTSKTGNSIGLTVPKGAGIKAGTKVKFRQENPKLMYELLESKSSNAIEKYIRNTSGGFKMKVPNLTKILKSLEENPYDKDIRIS